MRKTSRKAGLIGISTALLLAGALPAAASEAVSAAKAGPAAMPISALSPGADTAKPAMEIPTDTKVKKDEAIALAHKYVGIPEDYTVENVSFQSSEAGGGMYGRVKGPSWNINFSKRVADRFYGSYYVNIQADSGKLLNFSRYNNDPEERPSYPPETDLEEAKKLAAVFMKEMSPAEFGEARYNTAFESGFKTPLNGDIRYQIRYDRLVNGIPYPSNFISAEVDGNGRIVGYQYVWETDAEFAEAGSVLSREKALELWKAESLLTAAYFKPYERIKQERDFSVAYQFTPAQLDAVTGKARSFGGNLIKGESPLTDKPMGEAPKPSQMLGKEQAVEAVASQFALPKNAKLESASYNEYSEYPEKDAVGTWNIQWSISEDGVNADEAKRRGLPYPSSSVYATVNAATGEVLGYHFNTYSIPESVEEEDSGKFSFEDAKAKAVEAVKKLIPHRTHQLVLEYMDPAAATELGYRSESYSVTFKRVIDGVIAGHENVGLSVDRKSGDIVQYSNNLSNEAYPESKPKLIDPAKALDLWLGQYELELQYVPVWSRGDVIPYDIPAEKYYTMIAAGDIVPGAEGGGKSISLAYVSVPKHQNLDFNLYLDAVTGQWKNMNNGEIAVFGKIEATDAAGHWAERELRLMAEYRALDVLDGKVNPDRIATRGEMLKMLLIAMNGGYFPYSYGAERKASFEDVKADNMYFAYVENAVDNNLIDRNPDGAFNPDAPMTREEMAELIVRAMGYNSLAKVGSMFVLDVDDAEDIGKKGHAAIVLGLGIMTASDGAFHPKQEVTRAQAAVAFFRYLEQRSSLQERKFY